MLRYAIVGVAGILVGSVSVWSLGGGDGSDAEGSGGDEAETRRGPEGRVHAAPMTLTECRQELVQKDVEVRAARATAARAVAGRLFEEEDERERRAPGAPGGSSSTVASGVSGPTKDLSETDDTPEAMERERRRQEREDARQLIASEFEITAGDERALADNICTRRENERSLFDEFATGAMDAPTLLKALRQERQVANEGLRRSLGKRRFGKLQRSGALTVLSRGLCRGR